MLKFNCSLFRAGPIVQDANVDSNIKPILPPTEEPLEPEEENPPPRPDQGVQPPSITIDEEGAEAKDDVAPPSRKEDMPSFDEWKEKMLAQQAEEEKIKQQDLQGRTFAFVSFDLMSYYSATTGNY